MENILIGFSNVFSVETFLILIAGVLGGIIIGALPGLTSTMGVALLLPITYGMEATVGIVMLLGIYCGSVYGGSISAILLSTPGTPASAATVLDGHPMALRGEGGRALTISTIASTFGGVISGLMLIFISPIIAQFALKFGATEFFALAVFGLSIIVGISNKSIAKGLSAGFLGLLLATVGIDDITGSVRFTFGVSDLNTGFQLIPAMIGLFAISQVFLRLEEKVKSEIITQKKFSLIPSKSDLKVIFSTSAWSSILGAFIGAIPGTGGDIAAWTSYNVAKRTSKHPEEFGTGCAKGIAAPESANNGTTGGTLIPLLTLGIPGDGTVAIMLSALMINGLNPGLSLFTTDGDIMYAIMLGLILVNLFMFLQGKFLTTLFAKVVSIPQEILTPIIVIFCFAGAYSVNENYFDVAVALVFGILAWILRKLDLPPVPILLGLVLGRMTETNFRRALLISNGDPSIFLSSIYCKIFLALIVIAVGAIVRGKLKEQKAAKAAAAQKESN